MRRIAVWLIVFSAAYVPAAAAPAAWLWRGDRWEYVEEPEPPARSQKAGRAAHPAGAGAWLWRGDRWEYVEEPVPERPARSEEAGGLHDPNNAAYSLHLSAPQKSDSIRLRLICRSGRFTAGDVPAVHDKPGPVVDVRALKLDGNRLAGTIRTSIKGRALDYELAATVKDGVVTGSFAGGKGRITGELSFPIATAENFAWYDRARLGVGMHWSISSVRYAGNSPSWPMQSKQCTKEQYEAQMKEFRAQNFDPVAWAKLMKAAGAKYFIPYVKHHDGFCMWNTQTHDYKVTNTPCGRDVIGELFDAVRAEGLHAGVRFSQADWHIMPLDMWPKGGGLHARFHGMDLAALAQHFGADGAEQAKLKVRDKSGRDREITREQVERLGVYEKVWEEYRPIMMRQYEELLTKYGRIDFIGGDGGYPVSVDEQMEMARKFRQWQPKIVFGSRVFFGCPVVSDAYVLEWANEHPHPGCRVNRHGRVPQVWGSFTRWGSGPRRDGATKPYLELVTDEEVVRGGPTAIGLLVRCASLGWNLMYDIAPHDTGDLPRINIAHLRALARYMKANGGSITGTLGGPYRPCWLTTCKGPPRGNSPGFVWGTTCRDDRIFLHVTDFNGSETVVMPPLPERKIVAATLLATGKKVAFEQTDQALRVTVPEAKRQWVDTVVVLRLDGSAEDLPLIDVPAVEPAGK